MMNKLVSIIESAQQKLPLEVRNKVKHIPRIMLHPFSLLPIAMQEQSIAFAVNKMFYQPVEDEELDFLEDKWLAINITDANYQCFISLTKQNNAKLEVKKAIECQPNVEFSATTHALALLMNKQEDPDTLFFRRDLMVTGDTELGLEIKNLLDDFDSNNVPASIQYLLDQYCKCLAL